MRLREVVTADGEIWVDENYADKYRHYTHTFVPDDTFNVKRLYHGYSKVPYHVVVPGVPVFARFTNVSRWSLFQPETYKLDDVYRYNSVEVRGTLGLESATAYHVSQVGVFYKRSEENEDEILRYETPNTPCVVKRRGNVEIGISQATNEPARFLGEDTFLLTTDIATFGNKLNVETDVLAFINDEPKIVRARVYGLVSAWFPGKIIVAPITGFVNPSTFFTLTENKFLDYILEPVVEPPETAMITGSTSGTITVRFEKEITYYKYALPFGKRHIYLAFRRGWMYHGFVDAGDSGGPLFHIPPREQTGPR